jgi:cytochrome-b5 reductase
MSEEERKMNDTTMPPPPNRKGIPGAQGRVKKSRFGLADWNRLVASSKDLALRQGRPLRKIQWEEIRQHKSVHDGWIVLKGKVYNLSPYLPYHPGGETVLKQALGKDVTQLFEKYHSWVNEDR